MLAEHRANKRDYGDEFTAYKVYNGISALV